MLNQPFPTGLRPLPVAMRPPTPAKIPVSFQMHITDVIIRHNCRQADATQDQLTDILPRPVPAHLIFDTPTLNLTSYAGRRYPDKCHALIFGSTEIGNSVCCIMQFQPYFLIATSGATAITNRALLEEVRNALYLREPLKYRSCRRYRFQGWHTGPDGKRAYHSFIQVFFDSTMKRFQAAKWLRDNGHEVCEDNHSPELQFCEANALVVGGWCQISSAKILHDQRSTCQMELEIHQGGIKPLPDEIALPPLVALSVDGEMYSASGAFPNPDNPLDVIMGIGMVFRLLNVTPPVPDQSFYLTLGHTAPIENGTIFNFETEEALLLGYRTLLIHFDPDIVMGYNIFRFDFNFWNRRNAALILPARVSGHNFQGRLNRIYTPYVSCDSKSSAHGVNNEVRVRMHGRIVIDIMAYIMKSGHKLRSYKLTDVSQHFLKGQDKLDLDVKTMFSHFQSKDPLKMAIIAKYCIQDCMLPLDILKVTLGLETLFETSRVTSVPPPLVYITGQQIKIFNAMVRFAHENGFVIDAIDAAEANQASYKGGEVLKPIAGVHKKVATLDFAALYPNIMIQQNLSYDTRIMDVKTCGLPLTDIVTIGTDHWVSKTVAVGVLPLLLQHLLSWRKQVRAGMKTCTDQTRRQMMNRKQLVIKVICNSTYGFTGTAISANGKYPCRAIARCTTRYGRDMLKQTVALIERTKFGPTKLPAVVVYGDTDSVFVRWSGATKEEVFQFGAAVCTEITTRFNIDLEFEKFFSVILLLAKKRYAGMAVTSLDQKTPTRMVSGIDTVRRDVSLFQQNVYSDVLASILNEDEPPATQEILHDHLCRLEDDLVSIEEHCVTCKMGGTYKSSTSVAPQFRMKMNKRSIGSAPKAGERFAYVTLVGPEKQYMRAEDPAYAKANNLVIDRLYLLERVEKSVSVLFAPFCSKPAKLFVGCRRRISGQPNKPPGGNTISKLFGLTHRTTGQKAKRRPEVVQFNKKKRRNRTFAELARVILLIAVCTYVFVITDLFLPFS